MLLYVSFKNLIHDLLITEISKEDYTDFLYFLSATLCLLFSSLAKNHHLFPVLYTSHPVRSFLRLNDFM